MMCDSWWKAALEGAGICLGVELLGFGWLMFCWWSADRAERMARMRADD